MSDTGNCARCGGKHVVHGTVLHRAGFRPEGLKWLSLSFEFPEVHIPTRFEACLDCGLFWTEVNPDVLRQKLLDHGGEELKRQLGLGPDLD